MLGTQLNEILEARKVLSKYQFYKPVILEISVQSILVRCKTTAMPIQRHHFLSIKWDWINLYIRQLQVVLKPWIHNLYSRKMININRIYQPPSIILLVGMWTHDMCNKGSLTLLLCTVSHRYIVLILLKEHINHSYHQRFRNVKCKMVKY